MDNQILISKNHCFVCGEYLNENKTLVLQSTKVSDKPIYKFIETFVGGKFDEFLFSKTSQAAVCETCLEKLEEYDKICLQAARIQDEISQSFTESQTNLHSKESFLKCKTCLAQCADFEDLNSHECIVPNSDDYESFDFVEYADQESEELNEIKEEVKMPIAFNYTCNVCQENFSKKKNYQYHSKFAHLPQDAEIFNCQQCTDSIFVSQQELQLHIVVSHPSDPTSKVFQCPVCPKTFATKALINRHFGIHSATDRPFICEKCAKSFFHYSSFQAHVKMHADTRDYQCRLCLKTFRSQSHLNRHVKTHTKQKDHVCPECGSRFAENYNLTAHLKTHFGVSRKKRQAEINVSHADP